MNEKEFEEYMRDLKAEFDVFEFLKNLAERPEVGYFPEEVRKAKRLAKKIENVRRVRIDPIGEGYAYRIEGREYVVFDDGSIICSDCKSNCIHELAFAFWLKERNWRW